MCLFTHFAAGALAGGATGNLWGAAATGAASHALLDAIPHYDHPDWRLELAGGLLALVFLLMMPFATVPALVGGLFGMAPDLENLFQKLGKMRRNQFIFPSHTGLIPHGRSLGPRSLVWQVAIFVFCFGALALLAPGPAAAAQQPSRYSPVRMGTPVVKVLASDQERTRIQVSCPVETAPADWSAVLLPRVQWALTSYPEQDAAGEITTQPPRLPLNLAVPTTDLVSAEVVDLSWWKEPLQAWDPARLASFNRPAIFRSVPIAGAELPLAFEGGILRRIVLDVHHPAQKRFVNQLVVSNLDDPAGNKGSRLDEPPATLLNQDLYRALARGGRQLLNQNKKASPKGIFNHFDATGNWVRLSLDATGLYHLTGQDLTNMGVATSLVDPAKIRLYRGGGVQLDADPERSETDQLARVGLTEVAIQVVGGQDGEWNLDDEIRFYGFGSDFWKDQVEPDAGHLEFYHHPYQSHGLYWLTWENTATPSPIAGEPLRAMVVDAPANGGDPVTDVALRLHMEMQNQDAQGLVLDNWAWDKNVKYTKTMGFQLREPMAEGNNFFVVNFRGYPQGYSAGFYNFMAKAWTNEDSDHAVETSFRGSAQSDSLRVRLVGATGSLVAGNNELSFQNANSARTYPLILDSFDIFYHSPLAFDAADHQWGFSYWREDVGADGQNIELKLSVPAGMEPILWDVSNSASPIILRGDLAADTLTCGLILDKSHDRHFAVVAPGFFYSVLSGQRETPRSLRDDSAPLDYLVIAPAEFVNAAEELADFHKGNLPGIANPRAAAVSLEDIYANFSGGQKDFFALRNYIKWVYENSSGALRFVCLLGNGTRDHRNLKNQDPSVDLMDILPAEHRNLFPQNPETDLRRATYGSDDGLVSFDSPPAPDDLDFPDLAIGRLPATTVAEANDLVARAIAYTSNPAPGLWRNKVLLVADDCVKPGPRWPEPTAGEKWHTDQAENLANNYLPHSLDLHKVFAVAYDFPPGSGVKPQVRQEINSTLNDGASLFYYVGHGAEDNLADEQIFQSRDISNLTNGMKRTVFIAFSCDVGVYDSATRRSMAELFLAPEGGGSVGSICASQVSYIGDNNTLSNAFYANLYPGVQIPAQQTLSEALVAAKATMASPNSRRNSQRYNFLGDPALTLPNPQDDLSFAAASLDTIRAGARQVVALSETGGPLLGVGDAYRLRVEESAWDHGYVYTMVDSLDNIRVPRWQTFVDRGAAVFDGNGTMSSGQLRIPFKVPVQLRYGDRGRVRLVVSQPDGDHTAYARVSAVRQALLPNNDVAGPQIGLAFADGRVRVRAGTQLNATLQDTSSIAILGTTPGNSILLEFDDSGFMTDVTNNFVFDPDSYTQGRLAFPLPGDLPMGKHRAALHASDVLGNVGSDTLSFTIVPQGVVGMESVTLFPNPTPGPCRLLFELSDAMSVQWEIYTLSGHRIKTLKAELSAGPQILPWDGRDDQGDEIANGTYLYVLRGTVTGGGPREITETGKLVIMQ